MLNTMNLSMIITVLNLKFAHDSRHICCLGQTKDQTIMVFLIDTEIGQILGATDLIYSVPFKIRDICFKPGSVYQFVSCGIQHMAKWTYNGNTLQYSTMAIMNPRVIVPPFSPIIPSENPRKTKTKWRRSRSRKRRSRSDWS